MKTRPTIPTDLSAVSDEELAGFITGLKEFGDEAAFSDDPDVREDGQLSIAERQACEGEVARRARLQSFEAGLLEKVDAKLGPLGTQLSELTDLIKGGGTASGKVDLGDEGGGGEGGEGAGGAGAGEGGEGGEGAGAGGEGEGGDAAADAAAAAELASLAGLEGLSAETIGEIHTAFVGEELSPEQLAANDRLKVPAVPRKDGSGRGTRVVSTRAVQNIDKDVELSDKAAIAEMLHQTARTMREGDSRTACSIEFDTSDWVNLTGDIEGDLEKIARFSESFEDEVVASGGWGAHSEVRYGMYGIEATDGMWTAPRVGLDRGGLKWPVSPSIADYLPSTNTGIWLWTEANDITAASNLPITDEDYPGANIFKPHYKVQIPSMTEARLDLHGVIMENGNLVARAWPEAVRRALALTLAANDHTINSRRLTALAAAGTAVDLTTSFANLGLEIALVEGLDLKRQTYIGKYRMENDPWFEVVLPHWLPSAMSKTLMSRANEAEREWNRARLTALLATRKIRVQWVQDWQMLAGNATNYPTTFYSIMYPPGTYVIGSGPTIDLGVQRDSLQNATNDHTALWTEQSLALMKFGHESLTTLHPLIHNGYSKVPT